MITLKKHDEIKKILIRMEKGFWEPKGLTIKEITNASEVHFLDEHGESLWASIETIHGDLIICEI